MAHIHAANKTFDLWIELIIYPYPGGETIIKRFARRAMAYPTMIEGRLNRSNGISDFHRQLSDWKGNPKAAVITFTGSDEDGVIRTLVSELRTSLFRRFTTTLYLLSSEYRKDPDPPTPLILHRGAQIFQSPRPGPRRTFSLQASDSIGSTWYRLNPSQTVQTGLSPGAFWSMRGSSKRHDRS